jgi:hypothetical protein
MRTLIGTVTTTLITTALCLSLAGTSSWADGDEPAAAPQAAQDDNGLTGQWRGSFKTTSRLAPRGEFVFNLKEAKANHVVSGPFTGTVTKGMASGTAFKGVFTGTRSGAVLNGTVAITEPHGVTGDFKFQDATISGDGDNRIAGKFAIAVAYSLFSIDATGGYAIAR